MNVGLLGEDTEQELSVDNAAVHHQEVELGYMNDEDNGANKRLASDSLLGGGDTGKRQNTSRSIAERIFNYPESGRKLRSTAWLDGLRGLAAFEVFIFHYLDFWPVDKAAVWGAREDGHNPGFLYMPLVRSFLFSGDTAVCMFFAISGYVLSHRVLVLIQEKRQENILPILSSAIFRRGIRLYLPVLVQSFVLMLLARLFSFPKPEPYTSAPTFWLELRTWFLSFIRLLMPLRFPERFTELNNSYDGGISWTIPLEFYGSLQIFLAILALAYCGSSLVRRALLCVWVTIAAMRDDWITGQFLLGLAFADYQIERQRNPSQPSLRWQKWRPRCYLALFILGFYISGMPSASYAHEERGNCIMKARPGFNWMTLPPFLTDWYMDFQVDRMIRCVAAIISLVAVGESPVLRRCTELRFVQYLGRISFGLYMCHIWVRPCLKPIGILTCRMMGIDPGEKTGALVPVAWTLYFVPSVVVNFIIAGLFERYLDNPSIEAGKRLEKIALSFG